MLDEETESLKARLANFRNYRIRYDAEDEIYSVLVDNAQGDKGHPLVQTYWPEVAVACMKLLEAAK